MTLSEELVQLSTVFIDTAPIIYYIEAHSLFGNLAKEFVDTFRAGRVTAYSLWMPYRLLLLLRSVLMLL